MDSTWLEFTITVYGTPQANPKLKGNFKPRDPNGRKAAWRENVAIQAKLAMRGRKYAGKGTPVMIGGDFYFRQAKSNKTAFHTQKPDYSNLVYYVENILQGLVYHDDCQVKGHLGGSKYWCPMDNGISDEPRAEIHIAILMEDV